MESYRQGRGLLGMRVGGGELGRSLELMCGSRGADKRKCARRLVHGPSAG